MFQPSTLARAHEESTRNMSKPYICPKCGQNYSSEERSKNLFCRKCGTWLIVRAYTKQSLVHPIDKMTKSRESFIKQIYSNVEVPENSPFTECDRCFAKYQFSKLDDFPHKPCFPPIGSSEFDQVLFIGTNPRCRPGTKDEFFYRHALSSLKNFLRFSIDGIYKDPRSHTKRLFDDPHYRVHKECLAKVNPSWKLGQKSSVAELFMCGSEDANIFYRICNLYQKYSRVHYICAEEYLIKYMELVKPKIVVSFGWLTMQWLQTRFANDLKRDMQYLDGTAAIDYVGDPRRKKITKLHACFSRIRLDSGHVSDVIFSLHPNRMKDKEKLLRTFHYVAKNAGL